MASSPESSDSNPFGSDFGDETGFDCASPVPTVVAESSGSDDLNEVPQAITPKEACSTVVTKCPAPVRVHKKVMKASDPRLPAGFAGGTAAASTEQKCNNKGLGNSLDPPTPGPSVRNGGDCGVGRAIVRKRVSSGSWRDRPPSSEASWALTDVAAHDVSNRMGKEKTHVDDPGEAGPAPGTPARPGAPFRKAYRTGDKAEVVRVESDRHLLEAATAEYERSKFAGKGREGVESLQKWWAERAAVAGLDPYPITRDKLALMGALLLAAGYRSAPLYFSAVRRRHIELGHHWSDSLSLEVRDGTRACTRGAGPPRKCGPLDMAAVAALPDEEAPCVPKGPKWPRDGVLLGCWWAMREVELSTARVCQVSLEGGPGCGAAVLDLPVSKADVRALGKRRRLECACGGVASGASATCPVAIAVRLRARALRDAGGDVNGPLWPTAEGTFALKKESVLTMQALAARTGAADRVTGHTCRVTGAQTMAKAGIDVWVIQSFCRWGSAAVLEYVRDCHLDGARSMAREVAKSLRLDAVREEVRGSIRDGLAPEGRVEEAVLGELCGGAPGHEHEKSQDIEAVRALVHDVLGRVGALEQAASAPTRTYVANRDRLGKVHVARTFKVTWCGWAWAGRPQAEPMAAVVLGALMCATCERLAGRGK